MTADPSGSEPTRLGGRSPVGGAGQGTPGDAGLSGVRERLIEAMAKASHPLLWTTTTGRVGPATMSARADALMKARRALNSALPLIADEIETRKVEYVHTMRGTGRNEGVDAAAALVRLWAADGAR